MEGLIITPFYDEKSGTLQYVIECTKTSTCAVIDPVLDEEDNAPKELSEYITEKGLRVEWLLETHVHADHISAAHALQQKFGGRVGVGSRLKAVQFDVFGHNG